MNHGVVRRCCGAAFFAKEKNAVACLRKKRAIPTVRCSPGTSPAAVRALLLGDPPCPVRVEGGGRGDLGEACELRAKRCGVVDGEDVDGGL